MGDKTKKQGSKKSGKVVRFPERGQYTDEELHEIMQSLLDSGHRRHVELYLIAWRDYFSKGGGPKPKS